MTIQSDFSTEEAEYDEVEGEICTLDEDVSDEVSAIELDGGSSKALFSSESERVSEEIAKRISTWRGVRSCNDQGRADAAARPVAQAWVNATIESNPDRQVIAAGYSGVRNYRNETTGSGRRKCKGWWSSCIVYVDFAK